MSRYRYVEPSEILEDTGLNLVDYEQIRKHLANHYNIYISLHSIKRHKNGRKIFVEFQVNAGASYVGLLERVLGTPVKKMKGDSRSVRVSVPREELKNIMPRLKLEML